MPSNGREKPLALTGAPKNIGSVVEAASRGARSGAIHRGLRSGHCCLSGVVIAVAVVSTRQTEEGGFIETPPSL